jgi:hypothetical protein
MSQSEATTNLIVWIVMAIAIAGSITYLYSSYSYLGEPSVPSKTMVDDYTGKVIQVDHPTTFSGGFLFSSSRTDTYVTFDNNKTYWASGYQSIVSGLIYHVHSVTTIDYGPKAMGNGTLTTIVNTFSLQTDKKEEP